MPFLTLDRPRYLDPTILLQIKMKIVIQGIEHVFRLFKYQVCSPFLLDEKAREV
jgi:hypothetical protein